MAYSEHRIGDRVLLTSGADAIHHVCGFRGLLFESVPAYYLGIAGIGEDSYCRFEFDPHVPCPSCGQLISEYQAKSIDWVYSYRQGRGYD